MNARRWLAGLFLLVAAPAGYLTWLMWRAGDSGQWLFGVFTLFFLLLAVTPLVPEFGRRKEPRESDSSTRFVPHWFMLLAIVALLLSALLAIVAAVLRFLK